jgi:lipopolysaccharide export system ATP-binding protein
MRGTLRLADNTHTLVGRNLVKAYGGRRVVDHVDLSAARRNIVGLLGPNGAGKTTTFHMIIGLTRPDEGRVFLEDQDITEEPIYLRARKGLYYLAQEPSVFRKLTVEENLVAVMEAIGMPRHEISERLKKLLSELGLSHLAKQKAISLSGGERRRLEITRALITEPKFMLLDEPFAGIDPRALNDVKQIIRQLKSRGLGIVISDHNVRETLEVCDSAYIISHGRIIEQGSPENVVSSAVVRDAYLGNDFSL